jgi:hypothetical protein
MIIEADSSHFPIIIFKSLPVEVSDVDLENTLSFYENFLQNVPSKVILIYEVSKVRFLSSDQITRISEWSKKNKTLFREKTIDTCVVSTSILSTLIMKAMKFMMKSSFKAEIYSSMSLAMQWADTTLLKNQILI